jgi:hypothetical protein
VSYFVSLAGLLRVLAHQGDKVLGEHTKHVLSFVLRKKYLTLTMFIEKHTNIYIDIK